MFAILFSEANAQKQALPLPDGSYVTIREGETPLQTWIRAQAMYPKAFGMESIPENKKYDLDYFNDCKLKIMKEAKTDVALMLAIDSCKYKAIPKKFRAFQIKKDAVGNEKADELIICVEECNKANSISKLFGECSKG